MKNRKERNMPSANSPRRKSYWQINPRHCKADEKRRPQHCCIHTAQGSFSGDSAPLLAGIRWQGSRYQRKGSIFIIEPNIWLASCKPEALCSGGNAASLSCVRATDGIVIAVARTRVRVGIKQAKIRTKLPVCFNCAQSGHSGNTSIPMPNRARTMMTRLPPEAQTRDP